MWHKKKVVGLFSMGKVQRVLEQYALKGSKVTPLDASLFANTFLTRSEKAEFKVGLQTYLDAVPYTLAEDGTR